MMEVDLSGVLRDSVQLISNQAKIGKVAVSMSLPDQKIVVYGNSNLLQQMFLNVFLNAFDSMPDGGRLGISVETVENIAQVHIEDSGCGISPENLAKIFDPFFTLSPVGKGTGLGLSICYSIAKEHLGNIEVQSEVGAGSIFTVTLPIL
jgi:signal transduction histidine kinase